MTEDVHCFVEALEEDPIPKLTEILTGIKTKNQALLQDAASNGGMVDLSQVSMIRFDTFLETFIGGEDSTARLEFEIAFESRMNELLVNFAAQARMAKLTAPADGLIMP